MHLHFGATVEAPRSHITNRVRHDEPERIVLHLLGPAEASSFWPSRADEKPVVRPRSRVLWTARSLESTTVSARCSRS
jgi:hypothetical protein